MSTIDELKRLIQQQFDIDPQTIDADAPFATYDLDSLTLAELVFAIEDRFHVDFPHDVSHLKTLADVAGVLDGLPRKAAAGATA